MKKLIILASIIFLSIPFFAGAASVEIKNPLGSATFQDIINRVVNFIFWFGVALAPLMVVIAGVMILSARDDAEQVKRGRQIILYVIIGLGIILFAKGIISILNNVLGVKSTTQ